MVGESMPMIRVATAFELGGQTLSATPFDWPFLMGSLVSGSSWLFPPCPTTLSGDVSKRIVTQGRRYEDVRAVSERAAAVLPNQRLKLPARGGHLVGNWIYLSVAAAGRSLSAIR